MHIVRPVLTALLLPFLFLFDASLDAAYAYTFSVLYTFPGGTYGGGR